MSPLDGIFTSDDAHAAAHRVLAKLTTLHRCPHCGAEERTRSSTVQLLHPCPRRPGGRGKLTAYDIVPEEV
jgi:hypothetical protein